MPTRKKNLSAALGSMLTGDAPPAAVPAAVPVAPAADGTPPAEDAEGYARTSTGYRRGDGETVRRVSLMLTERQRRDLRRLAAGSANVTEYVVEALGLGRTTPGPRSGGA